MDTLSDLISVLNKKRLSKIDVLDKTFLNSKSENLYYKLYSGIESGQIKTDDEAAQLVYGTHKADPRYKMLKSRLKDKVLKSIVLLSPNEIFSNENSIAFYNCSIHNQSIEILMKLVGTTNLVYKLVKENQKIAIKYNFYNILQNYSYYLMTYYQITENKKMYEIEERNYNKYFELSQKEQYARYLFFKINFILNDNKNLDENLINKIQLDIKKISEIKEELNNIDTTFYYLYTLFDYYTVVNDINSLLSVCDEADAIVKENPKLISNTRKAIILYYRLKSLLYLKNYSKALKIIPQSATFLYHDNYRNWLLIKDLEFKFFLNSNKLKDANNTIEIVVKNKFYTKVFEKDSEQWKIYQAYLVFMNNYVNKGDYKFNLAKFLNDVPLNSKDKSGFNFAIRIIEILFLMAHKKINLVFAKMEALRIYRSRYLNDNTYKRNHLLLSLLFKAEKTGFDAKLMQHANWKEITLLQERNNIIADWEIIPYEELWNIFIELSKR